MGKWTQGPWAVFAEEADKPYIRIRGTLLGRRFKVANVCAPEWDIDESRANARLIAAAPELAEALKLWARWNDMTEAELAIALEATTAALAKAGVR